MTVALMLIGALFVTDNSEFFATVEDNIEDGFNWEYVGKTQPSGLPAITVQNPDTGEQSIYFKMTK
jgi:hypothetical protein